MNADTRLAAADRYLMHILVGLTADGRRPGAPPFFQARQLRATLAG